MKLFGKSKVEDASIFSLLVDGSTVATKYLSLNEPQKSKIEILILQCTYASLFVNTHYPLVSEDFDDQIRDRLHKHLRQIGFISNVEIDFLDFQHYLLDRVGTYKSDLKTMLNGDNYEEETSLPVNSYFSIVKSPLSRIYESDELHNVDEFNMAFHLKKVIAGLISAMNSELPNRIETQFKTTKFSGSQYDEIYFNYFPLFEDYCPSCGRFCPRSEMNNEEVFDFDGGFKGEMRICSSCSTDKSSSTSFDDDDGVTF